jgi:FHA domain
VGEIFSLPPYLPCPPCPFALPLFLCDSFLIIDMSIYQCSKGHSSTESDYCSECGTKIQGSSEPISYVNTLEKKLSKATVASIICPACSAPHEPDSGKFCEICGYNFTTGAHGEIPIIETKGEIEGKGEGVNGKGNIEKTITPSILPTPPTPPTLPTPNFLEITITVDPSLQSPESPEPPDQPPIILRLDKESNLIGRRNEKRGINPEIALNFDAAVSHRHALINRQPDGNFTLRDIESANGITLNGVELTPMVDAVLKDGDEFTLGHWTRIKIQFVSC